MGESPVAKLVPLLAQGIGEKCTKLAEAPEGRSDEVGFKVGK
jgi:hypothetical protein